MLRVKGTQQGLWTIPKAFTGGEEEEVKSLSRVSLFVTPWTVAYQVPLSMGFSRHAQPGALGP